MADNRKHTRVVNIRKEHTMCISVVPVKGKTGISVIRSG